MTFQEWLIVAANFLFWQAIPFRTVFIYWASIGVLLALRFIFKF
jgi:hypothetical protein